MTSIKKYTTAFMLALALTLSSVAFAQQTTQSEPNKKDSCCAMPSCCCKGDSCSMKECKDGSCCKGDKAAAKKDCSCCAGDSCNMKGGDQSAAGKDSSCCNGDSCPMKDGKGMKHQHKQS